MTASPRSSPPGSFGDVVRRRLREIGRSPAELADAVAVPTEYIVDLIAGHRRPPRPGRTDIYGKMTSFLRMARNQLVDCARAERADAQPVDGPGPDADVRAMLLALCEPQTARKLERRRARRGGAELAGLVQRILDVAQGAVRQSLDDQAGLRLAAAERGTTYAAMRFKILEFLDATSDTLTAADFTEFLRPRIARWDVDLETGVLRVVMRGQGPHERAAPRARAGGRP